MGKKIIFALITLVSLLSVRFLAAQDLGPHFKKVKDGIFVYAGEPNQSNCTIILTQDGVVLIDSGSRPPDSQAVMRGVKQLTTQPVRILINTEPHTDHATGHFVFSPPAIVIAAAGAGESMRKDYDAERMKKMMADPGELGKASKGLSYDHAPCGISRQDDPLRGRADFGTLLFEKCSQRSRHGDLVA
jgi:glyoxylase-like metal-dependent hydrolase (beta-lactamase superfamily II)